MCNPVHGNTLPCRAIYLRYHREARNRRDPGVVDREQFGGSLRIDGVKIAKLNKLIYAVRDERVMFDRDLAVLYGVETKTLNRAIKRNRERFPSDFMFELSRDEWEILKYQFGTSSWGGDRRSRPHAFTEHGIAMLSSVLSSRRAVSVNIEIIRAFVRLRRAVATEKDIPTRMKIVESAIAEHDRELTEHAVHINEAFAEIRRLPKPKG